MLQTKDLSFKYDGQNQFVFPDINVANAGELLILGASGIGKTTLLHLIGGLLRPESGSITLDSVSLSELSTKELDRFRGQHIGFVFQQPRFIGALTLKENLQLVRHLAGKPKNEAAIKDVVQRLGLTPKLNQKPTNFSQGEQQRAAIALAMINQPKLILADEPTASLDDANCERVLQLLRTQAAHTKAHLVIITHDQRLKDNFDNYIQLKA